MTYSIIAHDPETGQFGAAVQTCNLAVGMWVPWAASGVGVVATQAFAERNYGVLGLKLMAGGMSATEALTALLAADPKREHRQVAMLDANNDIATHTGDCCLPAAGSYTGDTFSTQANMVTSADVWRNMAEAYQSAKGSFSDRLMTALDAGQAAGGDIRGKQTAAIYIVDNTGSEIPLIDLRVDHHPTPVAELHRIVRLHRAYMLELEITPHIEQGNLAAVPAIIQQINELAPDEPYLQCLCALHLERGFDKRAEALAILQPLIQEQPNWLEYLRREVAAGQEDGCPSLDPQIVTELEALISA